MAGFGIPQVSVYRLNLYDTNEQHASKIRPPRNRALYGLSVRHVCHELINSCAQPDKQGPVSALNGNVFIWDLGLPAAWGTHVKLLGSSTDTSNLFMN